jgi:hypothetical protein
MNSEQDRLFELLDCILDRSYSDAQQQEFMQLLEANPQLSEELVEQLRTHSLLEWQGDKMGLAAPRVPAIVPMKLPIDSLGSQIFRMVRSRWTVPPRWRWAAAGILLMVCAAVGWQQVRNSASRQLALAEIVDAQQATWTENSSALIDPVHIVAGKLEMSSGQCTLRFRSGASVWIKGPASLDVVSDMLIKMQTGQATTHVPEWAHGFTIETPNVHVVDLGTRFGVMARGESTDVVVFEGLVDLTPVGQTSLAQKQLRQGEGVRVDNQGSLDRIVEVRRDLDSEEWSTQAPSWSDTTIKSIHDNIPNVESPTYYQITPHGLRDDCRAYVDCAHEWNGLTSEGLPDFLQHADYVRTCNDYRYNNELEITVELARPATLYIFFDRRVKPPSWLTEQFENTGVDIGLDEGPWWKGDTKHTLGVGGGQSIDRVFSVWSRRCATPETITLGPMGTMKGGRAMYGIAATPIE